METRQLPKSTLRLTASQYSYSLTINAHVRQENEVDHPMHTPLIQLFTPIDKTVFPTVHLAAMAKTHERPCLWFTYLRKKNSQPGLYHGVLPEGDARYYLLFYFPTIQSHQRVRLDSFPPFYLLALAITDSTPKPHELWRQVAKQLKTLPPLINP